MTTLSEMFAALESPLSEMPAATTELKCTGQLSAAQAMRFATAGNATLTFRSKRTGTRFTYRIRKSEDEKMFFVSLLTGSDNESSYSYMGHIPVRSLIFFHGKKAKVASNAPSVVAFSWSWQKLVANASPADLEIWHEGSCGRCGRKLTVPESIASGFGPECSSLLGIN